MPNQAPKKMACAMTLANWDVIPLNPTLFGEWKFREREADSYELKALLGDEIAPRWHSGVNVFFEQQVGDEREQEIAASGAVSYVLIDQTLSLGVEAEFKAERPAAAEHNDFECTFEIGPSLQWRPFPRVHVDVVPLFGATDRSPIVESFVFVGIDFGSGSEATPSEVDVPASM